MERVGRSVRLSDLAAEAEVDLDEALVTLWDSGMEYFSGPNDSIPAADVRRARQSLGLPDPRELMRCEYWCIRLGVTKSELCALLAEADMVLSLRARNLPKGALSKLRRLHGVSRNSVHIPTPRLPESASPPPSFHWLTIGKVRTIKHLSADDLLRIHQALEDDFCGGEDPVEPPGPRDIGLVESAAMRPQTSISGFLKYESVEMAAAALLHSVVHNHAFNNGNKRTALVAMLVLLDANDMTLTCTENELFRFVLKVAQHKLVDRGLDSFADREAIEIARWIRSNSRQVDRSERLVKWHKLRQVLASHGCVTWHPNVGNRINIERKIETRGLFRQRIRSLSTQVAYGDEGREVDRATLRRIRRDLELDDDHGVDSAVFYAGEAAASDFISAYRKTLKRLAKL
jgi:death-on-curing family protein